jgi:hypothetical protein
MAYINTAEDSLAYVGQADAGEAAATVDTAEVPSLRRVGSALATPLVVIGGLASLGWFSFIAWLVVSVLIRCV